MNRDHALFALMGIVVGFVAAYPVFEVMSTRQPALRVAGSAEAAAPSAPANAAAGGPMLDEIRRLRERVESNPDDAEALLALGQLNLQINDLIRARALFERYVALRPEDPQAVVTLANLYFDSGDFAKARDRYQEALASNPAQPELLTDLGTCYRNLGDSRRALELFRQAQVLRPDMAQAVFNEVVVLGLDLGDFSAALAQLDRLRQLQPGNPQVEALAQEIRKRQGS